MSRLAIAAKATIISQIFRFVGLGLSFVTVPLYLSWLGPERYGLLLTGMSLTSILMLSNGGLNWASMLLISQAFGRGDRQGIQALLRNSITLNALLSLVVAALVAAAVILRRNGFVLPLVPEHPEMNDILMVLGATVIFRFLISPISGLFIGLQQLSTDTTLQGIGTTLGVLAGLGAAARGGTIAHIFLAQLGGSVLLGVWSGAVCAHRNAWAFKLGPLWEADRMKQLFSSAMKSLTMQAGVVLWSSAPVVALSKIVGPGAVPNFTVPSTLLGVPYGLLANFHGSLQAAYGEALGRNDVDWIRNTLRMLTRQSFILISVVAVGFLLLAESFVMLWTNGKLAIPYAYYLGALLCFLASAPLLSLRGALAGMNRHRVAAVGDLSSGVLAFAIAWVLVSTTPPSWIGLAPAAAAIPLWWLFPNQFAAITGLRSPTMPGRSFVIRILLIAAGTTIIGLLVKAAWLRGVATSFGVAGTATAVAAAFCVLGYFLLREDFGALYTHLRLSRGPKTRRRPE